MEGGENVSHYDRIAGKELSIGGRRGQHKPKSAGAIINAKPVDDRCRVANLTACADYFYLCVGCSTRFEGKGGSVFGLYANRDGNKYEFSGYLCTNCVDKLRATDTTGELNFTE